jgi:hypothetical protein
LLLVHQIEQFRVENEDPKPTELVPISIQQRAVQHHQRVHGWQRLLAQRLLCVCICRCTVPPPELGLRFTWHSVNLDDSAPSTWVCIALPCIVLNTPPRPGLRFSKAFLYHPPFQDVGCVLRGAPLCHPRDAVHQEGSRPRHEARRRGPDAPHTQY